MIDKDMAKRVTKGIFDSKVIPKTKSERYGMILDQLNEIMPKLHLIENPYHMEIVYKCKQILGELTKISKVSTIDPSYVSEKATKILSECITGWDMSGKCWKER
jgi:hypothetical protein